MKYIFKIILILTTITKPKMISENNNYISVNTVITWIIIDLNKDEPLIKDKMNRKVLRTYLVHLLTKNGIYSGLNITFHQVKNKHLTVTSYFKETISNEDINKLKVLHISNGVISFEFNYIAHNNKPQLLKVHIMKNMESIKTETNELLNSTLLAMKNINSNRDISIKDENELNHYSLKVDELKKVIYILNNFLKIDDNIENDLYYLSTSLYSISYRLSYIQSDDRIITTLNPYNN